MWALTGEVLDAGGTACPVLKAHSIADFAADLRASLLCHAPRNRHCGLYTVDTQMMAPLMSTENLS